MACDNNRPATPRSVWQTEDTFYCFPPAHIHALKCGHVIRTGKGACSFACQTPINPEPQLCPICPICHSDFQLYRRRSNQTPNRESCQVPCQLSKRIKSRVRQFFSRNLKKRRAQKKHFRISKPLQAFQEVSAAQNSQQGHTGEHSSQHFPYRVQSQVHAAPQNETRISYRLPEIPLDVDTRLRLGRSQDIEQLTTPNTCQNQPRTSPAASDVTSNVAIQVRLSWEIETLLSPSQSQASLSINLGYTRTSQGREELKDNVSFPIPETTPISSPVASDAAIQNRLSAEIESLLSPGLPQVPSSPDLSNLGILQEAEETEENFYRISKATPAFCSASQATRPLSIWQSKVSAADMKAIKWCQEQEAKTIYKPYRPKERRPPLTMMTPPQFRDIDYHRHVENGPYDDDAVSPLTRNFFQS
ncbi:MAG: hypothetical protein M1834_004332 [Cirrosporium novae-zelandiae]|nr:MAG: hypothetical protein M1834_004332 [Cirrosporium novae-zelandiae]